MLQPLCCEVREEGHFLSLGVGTGFPPPLRHVSVYQCTMSGAETCEHLATLCLWSNRVYAHIPGCLSRMCL